MAAKMIATASHGRVELTLRPRRERRHPHCGYRDRDIALPPILPRAATEALSAASLAPIATRTTRFFFAGKVPESGALENRTDRWAMAQPYSEGARQMVCPLHPNHDPVLLDGVGKGVRTRESLHSISSYSTPPLTQSELYWPSDLCPIRTPHTPPPRP